MDWAQEHPQKARELLKAVKADTQYDKIVCPICGMLIKEEGKKLEESITFFIPILLEGKDAYIKRSMVRF
ncbi:MAG: hypothetical protein QXX95_04180 [Nitrososphaerales archaeon]